MLAKDIKDILDAFEQAKKDYLYSYEQAGLKDKETQDILHALELDPITKNERNRLATRLQRVRRERRQFKDCAEANYPIYEFMISDKGKSMVNLLKEVLGKTRKVEEYHRTRTYRKRVKQ